MVDRAVWPFPGDTAERRAQTVAQAYREQLRMAAPDICEQLDERMRTFGQYWIAPDALIVDENTAITTFQAAILVSVREETIRQWACTPHPEDPARMVLPRFRRQGRHMTYLAGDVQEAAVVMRRGVRRRNLRAVA